MKALAVGGGAREHALCRALLEDSACSEVCCAPGGDAIAAMGVSIASEIDPSDGESLSAFCRERGIDLVVFGGEAPLAAGAVDVLESSLEEGLIFGPRRSAARLESSKSFTRSLCSEREIPSPWWRAFDDRESARSFLREADVPVAVKADGLAAGKGVILAETLDESLSAADRLFGSSSRVVIEERMEGPEASVFALADGIRRVPFGDALDYKRLEAGDRGPNTGGMGALSPAPSLDDSLRERVYREIIDPALAGMAERGTPFRGFLYAGVMIVDGDPKLVEFNVRLGDPECQALMRRLESPLARTLRDFLGGDDTPPRFREGSSASVVLAAEGYPSSSPSDAAMIPEALGERGDAPALEATIDHGGSRRRPDGRWEAVRGRVLTATASADETHDALAKAYEAATALRWTGARMRSDIGGEARQTRFGGVSVPSPSLRLDGERLSAFLEGRIRGFRGPIRRIRQFRGGRSNPTYRVDAASGSYVLRRKPPGTLLPSAHAIDREFRVAEALFEAEFPIPRPLLLCEDDDVIGSAFSVVEFVDGRVFWSPSAPSLSRDDRAALFDSLNRTLARLHLLPWEKIGLADFGKRGGYLERQIRRWTSQYRLAAEADSSLALEALEGLSEGLSRACPADSSTALIHGDFRLDNTIVRRDAPEVSAVIDWELAALGDPLSDAAYHMLQWEIPRASADRVASGFFGDDLAVSGIPSRGDYAARYLNRVGLTDFPREAFYVAFSFFRASAIFHGVASRAVAGSQARRGAFADARDAALAGAKRLRDDSS